MIYEKLIKLCLQYLEQDADTPVLSSSEDITSLTDNDTFTEYIYNIEHSIYAGISRLVQEEVIPVKEYEMSSATATLVDDNGRRLFHSVQQVYALDSNGKVKQNNPFFLVGNKIVLTKYDSNLTYYVVYHPTINDLSTYVEEEDDIYSLDLEDLGIPDEMAIHLKYMVYSELKSEDNTSFAVLNKNYFEQYIDRAKADTLKNVDTEIATREWGDIYGD